MERLDKFLCDSGVGTRSQVKVIIKSGAVTVDGNIERDSSRKIDPERQEICLRGERLGGKRRMVVMLNKPAGFVTATEDSRTARLWSFYRPSGVPWISNPWEDSIRQQKACSFLQTMAICCIG